MDQMLMHTQKEADRIGEMIGTKLTIQRGPDSSTPWELWEMDSEGQRTTELLLKSHTLFDIVLRLARVEWYVQNVESSEGQRTVALLEKSQTVGQKLMRWYFKADD